IIHEPTVEAAAALAFRMVGDGRADLVMKGHLPTPVLLKAAIHPDNGFTRGRLLSHVGFFQPPILNRILCLTDTGMVLYPDLEKKAAILENAIQFMQKMGVERPVAAILTASEKPTPKMPCSMDAVELVKMAEQGRFNNAVIWGPVDVSIALDPKAAEIKGVPGTWSGKTDIWLLPEMVGGNIVGKVFMFIAKAEAGGVIVGGKSPIIMLSRASTPEEKYHSILMGVAASQEG
ncbi:phosphate butyryltransferase, partial [bacterium]|nr:phosphate butyryltransferase [candidate division CSSED10-310 bacterium]